MFIFPYIGNVIIPIDESSYFSEGFKPPTSDGQMMVLTTLVNVKKIYGRPPCFMGKLTSFLWAMALMLSLLFPHHVSHVSHRKM